ncbi:MAG: hypothetical protein EA415_09045 [Sphaerobacteraceae bacterium]|nr:MAG: hypothetical protein EA415_09045 [Sphaerobacteraceae bacterium]
MSDIWLALGVWLPLGTIVPLIVSRMTGSDWRGALIEASIFAIIGLLILPILFALTLALMFGQPNVDLIFGISYILAAISVLMFRRRVNKNEMKQRYGIR